MAGHTGIPLPEPPPFDLTDFVNGLMIDAGNFLTTMVQPWRLIQIGIIIGLFVIAHLVTRYWLNFLPCLTQSAALLRSKETIMNSKAAIVFNSASA